MRFLPLLLLAAVGCGGSVPPAAEPPTSPGGADTALEVTVDGGTPFTLSCGGPTEPLGVEDADHAAAVAACGAAFDHRDLLVNGPPPGMVCTQQYGGSERARISGTLDGQPVDLTLTRTDGCGIANWDALQPLLSFSAAP